MAARGIAQPSTTELTEQEKFSIHFKEILKTAEIMAIRTAEIGELHMEIKSNMAKIRGMRSEINSIAMKYGLDPIPTKEEKLLVGITHNIPVSVLE